MNETLSILLSFDPDKQGMRNIIGKMNKLIENEGWVYTGLLNLYKPLDPLNRDETIYQVISVLENTDWLKPYKPRAHAVHKQAAIPLQDIDTSNMELPCEDKWKRYEDYFHLSNSLPHGIIIDENGKIRKGYISYLLALKYSVEAEVFSSWSFQPVMKAVRGVCLRPKGLPRFRTDKKADTWIYDLGDPVVPGDILLARTDDGFSRIKVSRIDYITGNTACTMYRKVMKNETSYL